MHVAKTIGKKSVSISLSERLLYGDLCLLSPLEIKTSVSPFSLSPYPKGAEKSLGGQSDSNRHDIVLSKEIMVPAPFSDVEEKFLASSFNKRTHVFHPEVSQLDLTDWCQMKI